MLRVSTKVFLSSLFLGICISGCNFGNTETQENEIKSMAQTLIVKGDLVGKITPNQLEKGEYATWYKTQFDSYIVDSLALSYLKENSEVLNSLSIQIFLGTWCEDSQREVPRIIKILNYLQFTDFEIIGLDTYKESPQGFADGMNIQYVPTITFFKNGQELNRIIESPVHSLEKDLISILIDKKYSPNY